MNTKQELHELSTKLLVDLTQRLLETTPPEGYIPLIQPRSRLAGKR